MIRKLLLAVVLALSATTAWAQAGLVLYPIGTAFAGFVQGPTIGPVTMTVTPTEQTVTWTAVPDMPWLLVSPSSGVGPGTVNVSVNPGIMVSGQHIGSVSFYTNGGVPALRVPVVVSLGPVQPTFTPSSPTAPRLTLATQSAP